MRRKPGALIPLEVDILEAALELLRSGTSEFHGYSLAKVMRGDEDRSLTAHGTLYRALQRLAGAGLLETFWEDAQVAENEGRPRRRLYRVTGNAELAVRRARADARSGLRKLEPGFERS